jgi:hypothetical protein
MSPIVFFEIIIVSTFDRMFASIQYILIGFTNFQFLEIHSFFLEPGRWSTNLLPS